MKIIKVKARHYSFIGIDKKYVMGDYHYKVEILKIFNTLFPKNELIIQSYENNKI